MPLEPNKTQNGVDLNNVDVSKLTLVDKENLLDDLSKKLKVSIRDVFDEAMEDASKELADMVHENVSPAAGSSAPPRTPVSSSSGGGGSRRPPSRKSTSGGGKDDEFEQLRKLEASTKEVVDKLTAIQRKKDKEKRSKQLRGNVYSDAGKRNAEGIDNIGSEYHTYGKEELEQAKKKLSDIQENVRFSTVGKENKILTDATIKLQQALEQETKARGTILGKIGVFMTKQNIDVVSIISGLSSHSPLVGLMTKYMLDTIRDHKEKKQKDKADQIKVGDIKKVLPRPDEPQIDDIDVKHDHETVKENLGKVKDENVRHEALENLHAKGKITTEQHKNLHAELLRPDYQPLWERQGTGAPSAMPQAQQPAAVGGASSPAAAHQPTENSPQQILRDHMGNPVPDWAGYKKATPKKQQLNDERDAWIENINRHGKGLMQKKHEENLKREKPADWDEELFGDFHAKPSMLSHMEKREAERLKNPGNNVIKPYESPVKPMMVSGGLSGAHAAVLPTFDILKKQHEDEMSKARVMPAFQQAAAPQLVPRPVRDPELQEHHPTQENNSVSSLLKLMEGVQQDQDKKLGLLSNDKEGPFSKVEKLDEQQLEELKTINKQLAKQIEQADLAAAESRRETVDPFGSGTKADVGGLKKKGGGKGGLLGGLMTGIEEGIGQMFTKGIGGKIGKWFGFGKKAEGAVEGAEGIAKAEKGGGMFSRWFKGGKAAGGAVEGAEGVAKGAGGVGRVVEGAEGMGGVVKAGAGIAEEGGMLGGVLGKLGGVGKVLGKLGGAGKLLGKLALPLTIIMGIIDFFSAFVNAEEFLGSSKKLTTMDRTAAGLGGVIKGLVGIIDFVLGLFGVKTDLGGIIGKSSAKMFQSVFKAIGSIFHVLYQIAKPALSILGPVVDFLGKQIGKAFEIIGDFFDAFSKFIDGLSDLSDPKTFDKGIEELKDGITGMLGALGKWFLHMMGVDIIQDAFKALTENFGDTFKDIGAKVMAIPGMETIKKAYEGVKDAFSSIFDALKNMVKSIIGEDNYKKISDTLTAINDSILNMLKWINDKINSILHPFGGGDKKPAAAPAPKPAPTAAPAPTPAPFKMPTHRVGSYDQPTNESSTTPTPVPQTPPQQKATKDIADTTKSLYQPTQVPQGQPPKATSPTPESAPDMGVGRGSGGGIPLNKLTSNQQQNIDLLQKELESQGMSKKEIAAVLGNVEKESGYSVKQENLDYSHTSNDRIRKIFGPERTNMSDDELTQLKKDPQKFGEAMYGRNSRIGKGMGNNEEGDGFKFRGRGFIQLTGKNNYAQASQDIFHDDRLVKNPDLVSTPEIAAKVTAWYLKKTGAQTASRMGINLKTGSQSDINLAYTSAIAGKPITKGQGYLGTEVLAKVNTYSSRFGNNPQPVGQPPAAVPPMATMVASAQQPAGLSPNRPEMSTPRLTSESPGMQLAQASMVNADLNRGNGGGDGGNTTVNAPSTKITNNNSTQLLDLRAKNTDTSYQRNQNAMFVPT